MSKLYFIGIYVVSRQAKKTFKGIFQKRVRKSRTNLVGDLNCPAQM